MKVRVIMGVSMVLLTLGIFIVRGPLMLIFGTVLLLFAQHEVMHAFEVRAIKPYRPLVYIVGLTLGTVVYIWGQHAGLTLILSCVFLQALSILLFRDFVFDRLLMTLFSILYPSIHFLALFALMLGDDLAFAYGFSAIFTAVGSDTFAWMVGRKLGRHKLCPAISPNKTVEGAVAGVFGSFLIMVIIRYLMCRIGVTIGWPMVVLVSLLCSIASQAGDLFASGLKRYCGIKDYSNLIPGHGGVMDRLDGILFSASAMYFVVYLINLF